MIGVFDSGVGGLGVLRHVRSQLPTADLVYVADHAAAPYGTRSLAEVEERAELCASWLAAQGCRVVTIACNTASAAALHALRRRMPDVDFVGMEPAVKPAAEVTGTGRVGVVATAATFQGELFASVVARFASGVEVLPAACPTWVELVEEGRTRGPEVASEVRRCLKPLLDAGIDTLVLACTHYPALLEAIEAVVGPNVRIIDPAPAVASQTARLARRRGVDTGRGRTELVSTSDRDRLLAAAERMGIVAPARVLALG